MPLRSGAGAPGMGKAGIREQFTARVAGLPFSCKRARRRPVDEPLGPAGQSRVRRRWVTRCGLAASGPSRWTLFSS